MDNQSVIIEEDQKQTNPNLKRNIVIIIAAVMLNNNILISKPEVFSKYTIIGTEEITEKTAIITASQMYFSRMYFFRFTGAVKRNFLHPEESKEK